VACWAQAFRKPVLLITREQVSRKMSTLATDQKIVIHGSWVFFQLTL
jgi:hypothetical protein